ncbi:MAG: c-type cytochrome domain-containing protein, partial [Planctomycetota bacterium]|nr:c-type cytochrome domain-containing protein [Planctomycetota bacterium]
MKPASYYNAVRPILVKSCQGCHQPAKAAAKIVLVDYRQLVEGVHEDEKVVVPGKPEESLLYREIIPQGDKAPAMPKKAEPLSASDVGVIKRWILEGAKDDTPENAKDNVNPANPPKYHSLPVVTDLDFSSDGKYLAVSGYHEVLLHKA